MTTWKVVPISEYQRLDVHPEDLLCTGHFRKCETYRGGGGYDQFPAIAKKRLGLDHEPHSQFVVQLYGCNLDCPYCYVTRSGVWGRWVPYATAGLVKAFKDSGQEVFHLMGGAPAIYLDQWPELIGALPKGTVFHSDFLLTEKDYSPFVLNDLAASKNCLFAVDVKGVTHDDWMRNTRKPWKEGLFWINFEALAKSGAPFYVTFTNPDKAHYDAFRDRIRKELGGSVLDDSFVIDLIDYDAGPYVDVLPFFPKQHS